MFTDIVILAGGAGTRLWPASVAKSPKQFMSVEGGRSFFRMALERALALGPSGSVLVVCGAAQQDALLSEVEAFPEARGRVLVLPEPRARNTAPAVAAALALLEKPRLPGRARAPSAGGSALLLTSDHLIKPVEAFVADAARASALAEAGNLVCFGVKPRGPSTGYGYLETAAPLGPGYKVARFREKPDRATAESFLAAGNFYWNSGMYGWRFDLMREELETRAPEVAAAFAPLAAAEPRFAERSGAFVLEAWNGLAAAYDAAPAISLDYAVSEKCPRVALVPAAFDWDDVGSWDEFAALFSGHSGEVVEPGSKGCFVYSDLPVALCGVEDLVVVVKHGAVLVARKGETQRVKDAVEAWKALGRSDLL
ncbi:MAG: NTP transferase domain-containing protein [Spirochaetia bacterium]|nr:NTP transferase domain-containing protein [Spirochaetia bacterium]